MPVCSPPPGRTQLLHHLEEENLRLSRTLLDLLANSRGDSEAEHLQQLLGPRPASASPPSSAAACIDEPPPTPPRSQQPAVGVPLLPVVEALEAQARGLLEGVCCSSLASLAQACRMAATRRVTLRVRLKGTAHGKRLPSLLGMHEEFLGDSLVRVSGVPRSLSDTEVSHRFEKAHSYFVAQAEPVQRGKRQQQQPAHQGTARMPGGAKVAGRRCPPSPPQPECPAAVGPASEAGSERSAAQQQQEGVAVVPPAGRLGTQQGGLPQQQQQLQSYVPQAMRRVWEPVWDAVQSPQHAAPPKPAAACRVTPPVPPQLPEDEGSPTAHRGTAPPEPVPLPPVEPPQPLTPPVCSPPEATPVPEALPPPAVPAVAPVLAPVPRVPPMLFGGQGAARAKPVRSICVSDL